MKNILILVGSHRKNGNSDLLADAFIEGAKENGHTANKFNVAHHKILGCLACNKCWTNGKPCVQRDDMDKLYPLLKEADMLVFASPLYYFGMSSQLKAFIDRLYSHNKGLKIKDSALLVAAATNEEKEFEGITSTYNIMCKFLKWNNKGIILAHGVSDVGDIRNGQWLELAKALGKNI